MVRHVPPGVLILPHLPTADGSSTSKGTMHRPASSLPSLALTAALLAWGLAPPGLAPGWAARARESARSDLRNAADTERMERGYYEPLADLGRRLDRPRGEAAPDFGPLTLAVADVREYVLKPGVRARHRGASWSTNARGMRDRDHAVLKPASTYRIALVGDSIGAGWGVDDDQGFEPRAERALDARSRAGGGPAVEILNHAVPGLAPGQRWEHFGREGWAEGPDLVAFEGTPADFGWDDRKLRSLLARGVGWDAPSYRDALLAAGARPGEDEDGYKRTLKPHRDAILLGVYRRVVLDCHARGIPALWLLIPRVGKPALPADRDRLAGLARAAGFDRVVDLAGAFDGLEPASLAIGPDDFHPNALGHALLAPRLAAALGPLLDSAPRPSTHPEGDRR